MIELLTAGIIPANYPPILTRQLLVLVISQTINIATNKVLKSVFTIIMILLLFLSVLSAYYSILGQL